MDSAIAEFSIYFDIARCEALLGNSKDSLLYLAKSASSGSIEPSQIEQNSDFDSLRQLEAYKELVSCLKVSHDADAGFRQYYLSTLRCAGNPDEKEKYKWPIREAEKAQKKSQ